MKIRRLISKLRNRTGASLVKNNSPLQNVMYLPMKRRGILCPFATNNHLTWDAPLMLSNIHRRVSLRYEILPVSGPNLLPVELNDSVRSMRMFFNGLIIERMKDLK